MKAVIVIFVIIIAILAYALTRPVKKDEAKKSTLPPAEQQEIQASQQPAAPAQPQKTSKAGQIADEVNSVINYGMGATAVQAKKNAAQKLRDIHKSQNANLERELGK